MSHTWPPDWAILIERKSRDAAEARMGGCEPYKENTDKIVYMLKQYNRSLDGYLYPLWKQGPGWCNCLFLYFLVKKVWVCWFLCFLDIKMKLLTFCWMNDCRSLMKKNCKEIEDCIVKLCKRAKDYSRKIMIYIMWQ